MSVLPYFHLTGNPRLPGGGIDLYLVCLIIFDSPLLGFSDESDIHRRPRLQICKWSISPWSLIGWKNFWQNISVIFVVVDSYVVVLLMVDFLALSWGVFGFFYCGCCSRWHFLIRPWIPYAAWQAVLISAVFMGFCSDWRPVLFDAVRNAFTFCFCFF